MASISTRTHLFVARQKPNKMHLCTINKIISFSTFIPERVYKNKKRRKTEQFWENAETNVEAKVMPGSASLHSTCT